MGDFIPLITNRLYAGVPLEKVFFKFPLGYKVERGQFKGVLLVEFKAELQFAS